MKKNILLVIYSIYCFTVNAQWTLQNPSTFVDLRSIYFPTTDIGYAIGDKGTRLRFFFG